MSDTNKKILYLFDAGDWHSRMPVAEKAVQDGYDVTVALIGKPKNSPEKSGVITFKNIETPPGKFRGLSLLKMTNQIRNLVEKERPNIVHAITLKYSFITGIAIFPHKKPNKIYTLAGLGYLFRGENKKADLIRTLLSSLLKFSLKAPGTQLIFQNPDDMNLMIEMGFAKKESSTLIRGSGVPLDKFTATHEIENDTPIVLMPTRLVHEKGIHIFVEAARLLKAKNIEAKFQIAGGLTQHNPRAISRPEMLDYTRDGTVEWLGRVEDMPALLNKSALIVYPSYYGEGIPRVLLEACAAGRPIITTDHPGCREAVDHAENGLLVPIKDAQATANAIEILIKDRDLRQRMGQKSRQKAEAEFDINLVVAQTVSLYKDLETA